MKNLFTRVELKVSYFIGHANGYVKGRSVTKNQLIKENDRLKEEIKKLKIETPQVLDLVDYIPMRSRA